LLELAVWAKFLKKLNMIDDIFYLISIHPILRLLFGPGLGTSSTATLYPRHSPVSDEPAATTPQSARTLPWQKPHEQSSIAFLFPILCNPTGTLPIPSRI
jgi:hypothetical protein